MKIELKMVKLPLQNISVILFVAGIFFNILNVQAQKVYAVDAAYKADVKVFVVSSAYQADLLVYKVSSNYQAGDNDGKWFFTDSDYQADKNIYFVASDYQDDLKIYFVSSAYQAGWKKVSKKYLLYWNLQEDKVDTIIQI